MSEFEIIGNSYFNLVKELKKSYYIWKLIRTKSIIKIQKWWKNTYYIYLHKKLLNNYIEIIKRRNLSIIGKYFFQSNM